ncbi:unnamed protein product [Brassica rapa]|uniref:Uncharacterized protein n=1 Tax=Brassica campestris TaxID=3711 RepID=A0A8D9DBA8_BRACM|nr:unnamed protein product [Brassica rapa]
MISNQFSFCLEESRVSPPIDVYLVKTTMSYYNSLSTSGASPLCEWIDDRAPHNLVNCWIQLHVPTGSIPNRRVPSKDVFIPFIVYGYDDDPHGLVNCWIELRVPNSDSFLLFTVNGYDDGFHLIESFAFTSLRSVVNLTLLPSGSIRQTGDRVFLSEILPQRLVSSSLGNLADVLFLFLRCDKEVSDENMRCEIVTKDLVKHANEIDEKMVSETVKEELVNEIVKEDLVKDSDEIDENRRSENVREDVKHADEITQAQHLGNVTKDLVKETADAQTDIAESVKEYAEKATDAYLDRIRRQYIADQHSPWKRSSVIGKSSRKRKKNRGS